MQDFTKKIRISKKSLRIKEIWFKIYFKSQDGNAFKSKIKEIQFESAPFGKILDLNPSFWFPLPKRQGQVKCVDWDGMGWVDLLASQNFPPTEPRTLRNVVLVLLENVFCVKFRPTPR